MGEHASPTYSEIEVGALTRHIKCLNIFSVREGEISHGPPQFFSFKPIRPGCAVAEELYDEGLPVGLTRKNSATGVRRTLAIRSNVSKEGARCPRSIRLRKFRETSSFSANCSCVRPRNRRTSRNRFPKLLRSLLTSKSLGNGGPYDHQHKVCVSSLHTLYVNVV
jgi:hypothetical protein